MRTEGENDQGPFTEVVSVLSVKIIAFKSDHKAQSSNSATDFVAINCSTYFLTVH